MMFTFSIVTAHASKSGDHVWVEQIRIHHTWAEHVYESLMRGGVNQVITATLGEIFNSLKRGWY